MTVREKEPILSGKNKRIFKEPLSNNNPITIQVLGICSALAVTSKLKPSIVMGISVIVVMVFSSLAISMIRKMIPNKVRIIVEMIIVASMVVMVDLFLKAFAYDVSKQLSIFVGLIITNCIVLGRLEAFALSNKPWPSFFDAVGSGLGYAIILFIVGFFRELLGSGGIDLGIYNVFGIEMHLGFQLPEALYNAGYTNNGLMVLAPGAFFILGIIIWIQRTISGYVEE